MRKKAVYMAYTPDNEYRYAVYSARYGVYETWAQQRSTDEYMGPEWFDCIDLPDARHLADTLARAIEIGEELLRHHTG